MVGLREHPIVRVIRERRGAGLPELLAMMGAQFRERLSAGIRAEGEQLVAEVASRVARETLRQPFTLPPGFGEQSYTVCEPSRATLADVAEVLQLQAECRIDVRRLARESPGLADFLAEHLPELHRLGDG